MDRVNHFDISLLAKFALVKKSIIKGGTNNALKAVFYSATDQILENKGKEKPPGGGGTAIYGLYGYVPL